MENNKEWLPHLSTEIVKEARDNKFCSYLVALEGWRRGLTLKYYSDKVTKKGSHSPGLLFSLSSDKNTHVFYKSRGDKVIGKAFSIGSNKYVTKKWLSKNGIPVVEGDRFLKDATNEEIIEYTKNLGFPVVLKPVVGAQGHGVIANINDEEFLLESLKYVREELKNPEVIVERYFEGEEYRVYVVEDEVVAVMNRVPANVTGDGIRSVKELINMKNKKRRENPRLYSCLIKIDFEIKNNLKKNGLKLESIPENGEMIFLREKSNISTGGDSIELTDEFPIEIKQIAVNALKSIPDFPHGGVDIIYNPQKPINESAVVLELSPTPQIGSLVFPMQGKGRDVPAAIIDYYFPEVKNKNNFKSNLYFDLIGVLEPLISKSASEITVTPAPYGSVYAMKYIVQGEVQNVSYRKWIRKKALEADLYGFVQNLNNGDTLIVVAGDKKSVNDFKVICLRYPKVSKINLIEESIWDKPIKVGFEIKNAKVTKKAIESIQDRKNKISKTDNITEERKIRGNFKRIMKKFYNLINN